MGLAPACSTLCPTGALQWGKWSEISTKGSPTMPGFVGGYTVPHIRFVNESFPASPSTGEQE